MDGRSNSGAGDGGSDPRGGSTESGGGDLRHLFQSKMSEGAKRNYLLKLRNAAFGRLRERSARKRQV